MPEQDRKVLWSIFVVLATIAIELAWLIFIGPAKYGTGSAIQHASDQNSVWGSAAFWTAIFTALLTLSTSLLWWTTLRSTRLTERAFSDLERPYIYVFGVTNLTGTRTETNIADYCGVSYVVANFGKTPAMIREVKIGVIATSAEPKLVTTVDRDHYLLTYAIIGPSEERKMREDLPEYIEAAPPSDDPFVLVPLLNKGEQLFLYVVIDYDGPFTKGCKTSACWKWNDGEGVFVQYGGNDYNYVI